MLRAARVVLDGHLANAKEKRGEAFFCSCLGALQL